MPTTFQPTALRILVIDDEENIRFVLRTCLESDGHKVAAAGTMEQALDETSRTAFDLIFLDVRLGAVNGLDYIQTLLKDNPWARIIVITAYGSVESAVAAMKLGASDFLAKPFDPSGLMLLTRRVAHQRALERKMQALEKTLDGMEWDFSSAGAIWREAVEFGRRVATANAPVLITGERGAGKGRFARMVHQWSGRAQAPFSSISFEGRGAEEIESELFGGEESAQTPAVALCHGGTLLLEEIANLPLRLQPRLLTLLREKEFEAPPARSRRPVDVRIIATTSRDLPRAVAAGEFRQDLLMALAITQIDLPALRERPEDIVPLAELFLARLAREHHRPIVGFSRDAEFVLQSHLWPGNAGELRNVIERAVLLCDGGTIALDHLPADLMNAANKASGDHPQAYQVGDLVALDVIEEAHIRKVLASAKTLRRAAAILGVNASALCRKMKKSAAGAEQDKAV